ncbi:MAG: PPOX class F420-dependent oxidoreductase [Baekduia sp.]
MGYNAAPDGWWQEFVDATPARTAKLATVRKDGSPHLVPVWAARDGEQVVFMTSAETVKGRAILRDGRVSLCWDNELPPFDFVTIDGTTTTSTDPNELLEWATRIAARFMGDALAEQYGLRNAVPPEMVVRVTPTRVTARTAIAD